MGSVVARVCQREDISCNVALIFKLFLQAVYLNLIYKFKSLGALLIVCQQLLKVRRNYYSLFSGRCAKSRAGWLLPFPDHLKK